MTGGWLGWVPWNYFKRTRTECSASAFLPRIIILIRTLKPFNLLSVSYPLPNSLSCLHLVSPAFYPCLKLITAHMPDWHFCGEISYLHMTIFFFQSDGGYLCGYRERESKISLIYHVYSLLRSNKQYRRPFLLSLLKLIEDKVFIIKAICLWFCWMSLGWNIWISLWFLMTRSYFIPFLASVPILYSPVFSGGVKWEFGQKWTNTQRPCFYWMLAE